MIFKQRPLWLVKLLHFEYWTWWVFYLPLFPWFLIQAIRAKSLTYFTNVDPCIENGGFFGESKIEILEKIDAKYLPKTIFVSKNTSVDSLKHFFDSKQISFPIICKPNVGERGTDVEKIIDIEGLQKYINQKFDFIIQEFITHDIELAILYFRMPFQKKGQITSITRKKFLEVVGDGISNIEALMGRSERARFQLNTMRNRLDINKVIAKDEIYLLEPIGNHCRGTTFLDNNFLINQQLNAVFDDISTKIDGFHYGRFDLKVDSIENLYLGKDIQIMELNGVSADPGHIYDPNYKLFNAYFDVAKHWKILADISIEQQKFGIKPISIKILWPIVRQHFFNK
jgi:hypothetical protein